SLSCARTSVAWPKLVTQRKYSPSRWNSQAWSASHRRTADSTSVSSTSWRSKAERPITLSTSEVRGLLLQRLGKVLARLGQLRPRLGEFPRARLELLFQIGPGFAHPARARSCARTSTAALRLAFRPFARRGHLDRPCRGSGLLGLSK